jgi:hypothetical protein
MTQAVGQFSCRRFGSLGWSAAAVDRARHGVRVNYVGGSPGFLETLAAAAFWR